MKYSRFNAVSSLKDFAIIHTSCFSFSINILLGKLFFFLGTLTFFRTDVKHSWHSSSLAVLTLDR